jgi:hypothetical protein
MSSDSNTTDEDLKKAYDFGWHLREMGHTEILDETYKDQPGMRVAFEAGWKAAEAMVEEEQKNGWR